MKSNELKPDILDYASIVSDNINKQDNGVRRSAFRTLQSLLLELDPINIPIDRPLSNYVSNYVVSSIDWREVIGQLVDLQKQTKTKYKRSFRRELHVIGGAIVLPTFDPTSYFELELYNRRKPKIRYQKGNLELVDEGDYPYPILGSSDSQFHEIAIDTLVGSRLFFSRRIFKDEILSERRLYRRKLIYMLQIFASEVIKNIEVEF